MAAYSPSTASSSDSGSSGYGGSSGSGATHTIIVAPTQGVLRYVPFATNASVGDTIKFMWNANMHTVTKSSELEICNKTSDAPFASGVQNKSFVFTQVVNSTDPTFFYCGVPTHCQKGMFGIINPPSALTASTSVASMMPSIVSNVSPLFFSGDILFIYTFAFAELRCRCYGCVHTEHDRGKPCCRVLG